MALNGVSPDGLYHSGDPVYRIFVNAWLNRASEIVEENTKHNGNQG